MLATHLTLENVDELVDAARSYLRLSEFREFLGRFAKPDLLASAPGVAGVAGVRGVAGESRAFDPQAARPEVANSQARGPATEPCAGGRALHELAGGAGGSSEPNDSIDSIDSIDAQVCRPASPPIAFILPESPEWVNLRLRAKRSKLQYARELLSHAVPSGDASSIFDRALDALIEKAERRKFAACSAPRAPRARSARARCVPAHVRRAVWKRDGGQCTFVSSQGRRCASRRLLEYDHVQPVARGGVASVEGIRLRCRGHNQYAAEQAFGAGFMQRKREESHELAEEARARRHERRAANERPRARGGERASPARVSPPDWRQVPPSTRP
jgi:hypothetical protein